MAEFYIETSPKETGEHVIHSSTCSALPPVASMQYLGAFSNANAPVNKARDRFAKVAGCPQCLAA